MEIAIEDQKLTLINNLLHENQKNFLNIYKILVDSRENNEYIQEILDYYFDDYNEYNLKIELKIKTLENLLEYLNSIKNKENLELNKKKNVKKDIENIELNIKLLKKELLSL